MAYFFRFQGQSNLLPREIVDKFHLSIIFAKEIVEKQLSALLCLCNFAFYIHLYILSYISKFLLLNLVQRETFICYLWFFQLSDIKESNFIVSMKKGNGRTQSSTALIYFEN